MHRAHSSWSVFDRVSEKIIRRIVRVYTVSEIGKVAQFLSGHFFKIVRGIFAFDC